MGEKWGFAGNAFIKIRFLKEKRKNRENRENRENRANRANREKYRKAEQYYFGKESRLKCMNC